MRIALCQTNTIVGKIDYNKQKILDGYNRGIADKADLVIFPELALVGYPPQDLVEKNEFRKASIRAAEEIARATGNVGLIFGSITEDDDKIGTDIHNSAILCYNGSIQFIQHKTLIPNYDVFDEMRYFDPAKLVDVHEFKGEKLGISICEDIWNDADYWYRRRYVKDPIKDLINKGSTILINISASPYAFGKRKDRCEMLSVLTSDDKIPLVYTCCAGAQTELIFDGASMCFDAKGKLALIGKSYSEDYLIFDTDKKYDDVKRFESSFEDEVLQALVYGLKEYCQKLNFKKVLIGLSGGMDSALVTYIAVEALGKENVHVVLMPSKYSSEGSIAHSEKLIENLGISHNQVSIQNVVDQIQNNLTQPFKAFPEGLTEENIQARVRGIYLMTFANQYNYLLLNTGNKSEIATGYCTLYGDMCGGLAVIGDVYKTEVYRIAKFINLNSEIIPNEIIDKTPSAELRFNQTDQDTLPPYEILDKILKMYLEQNKEIEEISEVTGDKPLVRRILKMVDINEFKRKQAAPVLRVSTKAFGYGRRFPIVQGWRE